jgi:K+-transporting ATPase ATPase C chain
MKILIDSIRVYIVLTILTGFIYTFVITAVANVAFPRRAKGSLVINNGQVTGSELIGQQFTSNRYFQARPSAVSYNPMPSGGSNASVVSAKLRGDVDKRRLEFCTTNGLNDSVPVPSDMLFTSASGLDPHISPDAARLQINRIAANRNFTGSQRAVLDSIVEHSIEPPQAGILGEPRVNVLMLNMKLEGMGK